MKRILTIVFLSVITALVASPLAAQNQQGDDDSMLPEIDPQDIEIRSQFKARFPGLRRQPILGFEPASRIYKVDPDRKPYIESQEEAVANLSVSELSRPNPPQYNPLYYSEEINAFARAGVGSFISPEVQFWGVTRPSDKSYIGGDLDFSSSDGHLENQASSFRFLTANGEFAAKVDDQTRLGFNLGLQNSFNSMYGLNSSLDVPDNPRKEYGGFNLGVEVERLKNGVEGWKVQASARYYQAELMGGELSGKTEEAVYSGLLVKQWAGSNPQETFSAKLGGTFGDYSTSLVADQWMTGHAGVVYDRLIGYETDLLVDASVYYGSDAFEDKVYFAPKVRIKQPLAEAFILTARAGAKPYVKTEEELHTANRFLTTFMNASRHTYQMYGAADVEIKITDVGSLNGGIRYEDISNHPIFERRELSPGSDDRLYYSVRYADITKAEIYAGASHQIVPERFWLNGKIYAQSVEDKDGDRIPFTEQYGLKSGFGLRLFSHATVEGWADYTGNRKNDQGQNMEDYLLVGGKLDVSITDNIGVYGKVVNLLDQEYQDWEGYTERPLQIFGGITLKL
ncbi:hypothetical protein [Fodinibius salsisoli]|uniref:TonB dependent receptor n=1 Tax=Fodinibius salsisoli TaxID=2820877 RepID=A0ABT3PRF3_9BACT|nr:hypothetical protein [Fodinibius salsisoli]MCW9708440.1 hypothetical protein [Fodinibius salsisoli]